MSKAESVDFTTTVRVRDTCLCLHVQRAARALARRFDAALRPVGLTNGQFSLLMALNRPQPARVAEVAAVLAMDRTTLTASLKPLERQGLVKTTVDRSDRRGRLLALTDAGRRWLAEALPVWEEEHGRLERRLENADLLRETLHVLL